MNRIKFISEALNLSEDSVNESIEKLSFKDFFRLCEISKAENKKELKKFVAELDNSFSAGKKEIIPKQNANQTNDTEDADEEELEIDPKTGKPIVTDNTTSGGMAAAPSTIRKS